MLPRASLWRIARRTLAARIRGLRLLAVCLFLGVATLAAIGSLTRGITSELEVRGQTILGGDIEFSLPQREATAEEMAGFRRAGTRSEEHTSELQSLMRISYAVFCLKKKNKTHNTLHATNTCTQIQTKK